MTKKEWSAILRGAAIAVSGSLLAYAADYAIPLIQDSGTGIVLTVAAIASVAVNAARKWLSAVDV